MKSTLQLSDCRKAFRHDQDKARTPEETVRWVRNRLAHLEMDLLTKTVRIDTGRLSIPVFISLCGTDATRLTGTKKQMGKGASASQSEASAIMELMERFSFFSFLHHHPFSIAPLSSLGTDAVPVERLLDSIHDSTTPAEKCREFLDECPLRWVVAHNLTVGEDQWIPIDWFYLINEYNGTAAGNTLEEAILQSLCEVVERHVGTVVSYGKIPTPGIDVRSLEDPVAIELVEKFHRLGIRLFLRDFSLDTGIPTVGALAYDPSTFPERSEIVFAAGTTTSPEKSLCRALTEIAQLAGDFANRTSYRPTLPKYESLDEAAYLMDTGDLVSVRSLPNLEDDSFRVEIDRCVRALERLGRDVFTIEVTHPEVRVPAVYTVVPGAHFLDRTRGTDFAQHAARTILRGLPSEAASVQMERLLEIFGPRYDLTFFHAHSLELADRPREALAMFRSALHQDPAPLDIASIFVHMASCHKDLGEYRDALKALDTAEQHNPELKEIYNLRGFCHYRLKEHQAAIEAFERAIEIDPGSGIDYANIGSNLRELGFREEAIRLYRMALELDPDIEFARENLDRLTAEAGERE